MPTLTDCTATISACLAFHTDSTAGHLMSVIQLESWVWLHSMVCGGQCAYKAADVLYSICISGTLHSHQYCKLYYLNHGVEPPTAAQPPPQLPSTPVHSYEA